MASAGAGAPLLLILMLVGVLVLQHAVHGDDKLLLRAFNVFRYSGNDRWLALNDLFNLVQGSDVTSLMWPDRIIARDTTPLLNMLTTAGGSYSVATSNDSLYSIYYNRTMFSGVSTQSVRAHVTNVDCPFIATFEWAAFVGAPLSVASWSTTAKTPSIGSQLAQYINTNFRGAPFAFFGKFDNMIFENLWKNLHEPKHTMDMDINMKYGTKASLLLNSLIPSLINIRALRVNEAGMKYFKFGPLCSEFNLTRLRGELPTVPWPHRPADQHPRTPVVPTGHRGPERLTSGPSVSHPPRRGQRLQALRGQSSDWSYAHRAGRSTSTDVNPGYDAAGSSHAPPSLPERSSHQLPHTVQSPLGLMSTGVPARPAVREPQHHLQRSPGMISPVQLYESETVGYPNSPHTGSAFDTTGDCSYSQDAVPGDDTLRVGAFKVPAYTAATGLNALHALFNAVMGSDVAVLMWTDRANAVDAVTLLVGLNMVTCDQYSVETSTDSAYSFYYNSEMFSSVSIQSIGTRYPSHYLCIATFKWAGFVGVPLSVAAFYPTIRQFRSAIDLKSLVIWHRGNTSLIFFGNFPVEYELHEDIVTLPALLLNSMETSLIRHFNPTLEDIWMHNFFQPPLYSEFNFTLLTELSAIPRELQQDNHGARRPSTASRENLGYDADPGRPSEDSRSHRFLSRINEHDPRKLWMKRNIRQ